MADLDMRGTSKSKSVKCIACQKKFKGNTTLCDGCRCKDCRRSLLLCECKEKKCDELNLN